MATGPLLIMRCPREVLPAGMPNNSSGTTCSSSIATNQRTGRTNTSPRFLQYIFFGQYSVEISLGSVSARISEAVRPLRVTVAARYSPFGVLTVSGFLGERMRCRRRLPILICNLRGRAVHVLRNVRLRDRNARGDHAQTARRVEMRNLPRRLQSLTQQQRSEALSQLARSGVNHPRRDFFASDFE